MKADQTKHKQMSIFNSLSTIPVRQINWLVTTWAYAFRLFIYPFIKPELFDCLYSVVESRPATPPQITVSLLLIQSLFNKSDDEMHDWMMGGDIAIRFATDTLGYPLEKLPTCDKQLSRFRMKCQEYADKHDGENPLDKCLHEIEYGMCALMGLDLTNIRMDSTQISANMARLSRETLVYTANMRMLRLLVNQENQKKNDAIKKANLWHYLEPNDKNKVIFHSHIKKEDKQKKLAEEASNILKICTAEDLESEEGKLYSRIMSEQTVVEDGVRRFATSKDGTMSSSCVQNPVDPDATYRKKAGKEFIGYVTNFAEAVGTCGSQIVSWDFQQNVVNDSVMAMAFLKESNEIITGIERYNQILGIETPGDMEKCRAVLQEKMQLVKERILEAANSGRKIPRSMYLDPLYTGEEDADSSPEGTNQLTMDELLGELGINIAEKTAESSVQDEIHEDSNCAVVPLAAKIRNSFDSTPFTFDEEIDTAAAHETVNEDAATEDVKENKASEDQKNTRNDNCDEGKDDNADSEMSESVNKTGSVADNQEAAEASEKKNVPSQNDETTENKTDAKQEASSETSPKSTILFTPEGKCLINGIDVEEYVKKPCFALLPDELRRQAIIYMIRQHQSFNLPDLEKSRIIVADGAYSEEKLAEEAAQLGFLLLPTDLFGKASNPIIGLFVLDESRTNVVRCPMGETCSGKVNKGGSVTVKMEGTRCEHCPFRNDCKANYQPRLGTYTFIISPHAYDRIHTEAFLGSEDYKNVGKFRNGVETTPSVLHNRADLDNMSLGRDAKEIGTAFSYMDVNFRKFFAFLKGVAHIASNPIIDRKWCTNM